jgi:hypothetical protein
LLHYVPQNFFYPDTFGKIARGSLFCRMGGGAAPCSALSLAARDIAELRYIRYARRRRGVAVGHIVYTAAH